ncbi:MAG: bifunctional phosphoribosylaminoimidazolecarboxamide formyltransferase/IMP cyclohydrolase [Nannocystaceae bacterium]|nr:bifunctional phosphoribosylaminoimidazolecarboxamide formyltransferase/IMP cyclohydrolase [bacterium]
MATRIRRALVSVSDKRNLATLAEVLVEHKVEVLSTGGTYKALTELGVAAVKVSDYTGSPEVLGGRVKTLHPKIHGGILALPTAEHEAEAAKHDIPPIDLVVVNLYPFTQVIAKPGCSFETAIENIDIGGPTMVRAAAKNWPRVTVVVDPDDYGRLGAALGEHEGAVPDAVRRALSRKAFGHTAGYDAAIAQYLARHDDEGTALRDDAVPSMVFVGGEQPVTVDGEGARPVQGELRYGENPHQSAAFVATPGSDGRPGIADATVHQGKPLSYNNLLDVDAAIDIIRDLQPLGRAAAVFKHATPCGAAVAREGQSMADVYVAARQADAESAFGGIVSLTDVMDAQTASKVIETFIEVVIAPGFSAEALEVLKAKKNLRVLELPGMFEAGGPVPPLKVRTVFGGLLVQREDRLGVAPTDAKVATKRAPTADEMASLEVAWRVAKHVRSNAIVMAKDGATVGIGGGQTSRVEAARGAVSRAGDRAKGSVLASDGFFPFRDGVDAAAVAGVTAVVQPGGSKRDEEVIAAADEHGIAMIMTGERHFRH